MRDFYKNSKNLAAEIILVLFILAFLASFDDLLCVRSLQRKTRRACLYKLRCHGQVGQGNGAFVTTGYCSRTIDYCFPHYFLERTCEANAAGENRSFIFTVCVKSVPCYHFKLGYVVLEMAVK